MDADGIRINATINVAPCPFCTACTMPANKRMTGPPRFQIDIQREQPFLWRHSCSTMRFIECPTGDPASTASIEQAKDSHTCGAHCGLHCTRTAHYCTVSILGLAELLFVDRRRATWFSPCQPSIFDLISSHLPPASQGARALTLHIHSDSLVREAQDIAHTVVSSHCAACLVASTAQREHLFGTDFTERLFTYSGDR